MPLRVALVLGLAICLAACAQKPAAEQTAARSENAAPDFTLKDIHGKAVSLSDYKGKVVLLNFWATWCGPCQLEIPWFVEFEKKYKDQGFAVVGVSMDEEGWEVVKPFLEEKRVNYRVVIGDDDVAQKYGGVESLPTTYMIDKSGRIHSIHVGLVSKSDYENEIVQLLDGSARVDARSVLHARAN